MNITHIDVSTAYLNSDLQENSFVRPPDGIKERVPSGKVWKLKKAMCGLKQSGRAWNEKLDAVLKKHGLIQSKADPCIYYCHWKGKKLIVAFYVNDLLILFDNKFEEDELKETLKRTFEMKDLGKARQFLGMDIQYEPGKLKIQQVRYIKKILEQYRMTSCNPISTPADPHSKLTAKKQDEDLEGGRNKKNFPYKEAVGSLLYISQISRPDNAFAVGQVSRFCKNPNIQHWRAVKRYFQIFTGNHRI